MVGNRWWYHNLIWFLVSLKVLALGSTTIAHNHHNQSAQGPSLVNASLVVELPEEGVKQNLNIGHEKEENDNMVAMVASLRGANYGEAENEFEELQGAALEEGKALSCEWHLKLDLTNRYRLDWTVDYPGNEIIFALNINHTSSNFRRGSDVFALGFSENGQLASSDFCIIWHDLSHKLHLQDARTDPNNRLQLIDADQSHCKLLVGANKQSPWNRDGQIGPEDGGTRLPGHEEPTIEFSQPPRQQIVFKRPLDVCLSSRPPYYKIDNGTTHLVWFTIEGPLLSMDGLDLTRLEKSSGGSHLDRADRQRHGQMNQGAGVGGGDGGGNQFEWAMKRVQLIRSDDSSRHQQQQSAKGLSLNIRMDKFEIPARETTYWCKLFKLPHKFETRRYHLTEYEAIIERGNEHVVHHMELFNCANLNTEQEQGLHDLYADGQGGWSGDCSGKNRPKATEPCRKVILAWAMGARPLIYPHQVGQSIGGHGYSPYVVLEVHYNNVDSSPGLIDNSGLRFHYTSKLRPYDAGILEVGLEYTDKVSIPPGIVTPIAGHCVGECTRLAMGSHFSDSDRSSTRRKLSPRQEMVGDGHGQETIIGSQDRLGRSVGGQEGGFLEEGIYIFAGQMHTHLAGVASWTEIVREGRLVAELQRDDHYSPHFQEIRLLPSHVHVAPGDSLIHYCLYDTRQRANITLGGYATSDEMCVTYLHYYPRIDLEVCKSSVDTSALEAYFAYLARQESQNTSERLAERSQQVKSGEEKEKLIQPESAAKTTKTVSENYHSIQWNARRSKELIQFYAQAPLSVQCNRSNGNRWPGYWNGVTATRLWSADVEAEVGPFETRPARGEQLMAYRGRGFGKRHAQCRGRE